MSERASHLVKVTQLMNINAETQSSSSSELSGLGSGAICDIAPESQGPLIATVVLVSPHNRGDTLGSKSPHAPGGD